MMFLSLSDAGSLIGGLLTLVVAGYIFVGYTTLLVLALVVRWAILRRRKK
jgi:hypothetical protein